MPMPRWDRDSLDGRGFAFGRSFGSGLMVLLGNLLRIFDKKARRGRWFRM